MFSTNRAPIFNWHQHYLQIDQNEIPHDPRHLRVPSGASKTTSEAMVHSTQTLHLSCVKISNNLNSLNRASTWALSPRSTIGCIQNDFWACGTFSTNRAPILHQDLQYLQTNWIKDPLEPHTQGVPSGASKTISEPMVHSAQTLHLSCVKISTISNKLNKASTGASSPRTTIRCVQNDFSAYGTFGANRTPILCQD
jgi:hypothetical protein